MSWTKNEEYEKNVADLRRESEEIKARRRAAGPLPSLYTAPPPPAAAPPPPAAGPPPPRRAPPPPPAAARPPVDYSERHLMALLSGLLDAASVGNLEVVGRIISTLENERIGFNNAITNKLIKKENLKQIVKDTLKVIHPDKGGDTELCARYNNLIKGKNFGILSGEGKPKKCRKCGLYKY